MDDAEDLALSDPEDEDLVDAAPVIDGPASFAKSKDIPSAPLASSPANSGDAGSTMAQRVISGPLDETVRLKLEAALQKALSDLEEEKRGRMTLEAKLAEVAKLRQQETEARERQEAMRNEAFSRMKAAATDAVRTRDEAVKLNQEVAKALENLRVDCEGAVSLVSTAEAERIAARAGVASNSRPAAGTGQKAEGASLKAAVEAYRKRVEAVVDELAKQRKQAVESSEAMGQQMDRRNISIAIEVSEMEATITRLKEEVASKDARFSDAEKQIDALTRRALDAEVALGMERRRLEDAEAHGKSTSLEARKFKAMVEEQRAAVAEIRQAAKDAQAQLAEVAKARERAEADVRTEREAREKAERERETAREGERTVTRDMEGIIEQWREAKATWRSEQEELKRRAAASDELEQELASAKSRVGAAEDELASLRRDLAGKTADLARLEAVLKDSQNEGVLDAIKAQLESVAEEASSARALLEEAERGRREAEKASDEAHRQVAALETARHAAAAEASAASASVEKLREEVQALHNSLADARREAKDCQRVADAAQLETDNERNARMASEQRASDTVAELQLQVAALEEELALWKNAANEEAAAGAAVVDEVERCNKQIAALVAQIGQWKKVAEEASEKVRSKEEMASAAIAARDAAERSLQVADRRAAELRARVDTLASQLEDIDGREEARRAARDTSWGGEPGGCFSSYWPWLFGRGDSRGSGSGWLSGSGTWLGAPGGRGRGERVVATAEMEQLMEPFV